MQKNPYMHVVDRRFEMAGKGAPRETVFGVIGKTKYDPLARSLGGLVSDTKNLGPLPKGSVMSDKKVLSHHMNTDRSIIGPAPKTHIPGEHFGQVPFAGHFMSALGKRL